MLELIVGHGEFTVLPLEQVLVLFVVLLTLLIVASLSEKLELRVLNELVDIDTVPRHSMDVMIGDGLELNVHPTNPSPLVDLILDGVLLLVEESGLVSEALGGG